MLLIPRKFTVSRTLINLLPLIILIVMLGATGFVWEHERQISNQVMRSQFDFSLRETVSRIEQRIQGYEQMLRGVQSLFATTSWRNRAALHDYIEALQLDANFAGIQAIGMVDWVSPKQLKAHLASMQAAGYPDYAIEPVGQRDMYAPVIQREPYIGKNKATPGNDVWVDPVRRMAMEKARDSGMPTISGKVKLKVDGAEAAPPGFIMYLPVYGRGLPHDTLLQRRSNLIGWVYASFHMNEFMASLYGENTPGLAVTLHDGTTISEKSLLHRSETNPNDANDTQVIEANEYMVVAGHTWVLSLRTQKTFSDRYGRNATTEIATAGCILSLLLAWLAWLLIHGRARALRFASKMTEEIRQMAQHDLLTGLPNRSLFNDRLGQELARAQRHRDSFALLFVDLDKFKLINDTFGHAGGDQALKWVANQLRANVRASDTVGRIGGDEFVVLLAQLSHSDTVIEVAEKLRSTLKQAIMLNGREMLVSCSIGFAVYPQDGIDAVALMKQADDAMYRAKAAGRDCVQGSS